MAKKKRSKKQPQAVAESLAPKPPPSPSPSPHRTHFVFGLILLAAIIAVFQVTLDFTLLTVGDREAVTANPIATSGLTASNTVFVVWDREAGNWIPVTWISHMLDTGLFGTAAAPRHLFNVTLHLLSSGLFFATLFLLTLSPGRSLAAAAFFALHPLRAQSVAWVAERQGLLAAFFSFLTLAAWAHWKRLASPASYYVALGACALAMMSSPSAAVLPLILVLLECWPLEGSGWRWREKLPFLAMSLVTLTVWTVRFWPSPAPVAGATWRVAASFWPALWHTVWPFSLTPIGVVAVPGYGDPAGWTALALLVSSVVLFGDRHRVVVTGLVWFILALCAGVALSEFGWHSYSDRFTYFAHAGLAVALVWLGQAALGSRAIYAAVPAGLLLAWQCYVQLSYWKDDSTLVARAVEINPDNPTALSLLGHAHMERKDMAKAIEAFRRAVTISPRSPETRLQLAGALQAAGNKAEALVEIDRVIKAEPKLGSAYYHRGSVLMASERQAEAGVDFLRALEEGVSTPLRQGALLNLGLIELSANRLEPAKKYFTLVLEREPNHPLALQGLEMAK
jgi:Flp pilus assembly protein TadD